MRTLPLSLVPEPHSARSITRLAVVTDYGMAQTLTLSSYHLRSLCCCCSLSLCPLSLSCARVEVIAWARGDPMHLLLIVLTLQLLLKAMAQCFSSLYDTCQCSPGSFLCNFHSQCFFLASSPVFLHIDLPAPVPVSTPGVVNVSVSVFAEWPKKSVVLPL